jgi:hypothetical protein
VSFAVIVDGAHRVDHAGGPCGPCGREHLAIVASDGGANFGLDVLRQSSDEGVSTTRA